MSPESESNFREYKFPTDTKQIIPISAEMALLMFVGISMDLRRRSATVLQQLLIMRLLGLLLCGTLIGL